MTHSNANASAQDSADWQRAEDVFAEWLEQDRRQRAGFEDLCTEHPDLAPTLRVLHTAWQELEDAFDTAETEDSPPRSPSRSAEPTPASAPIGPRYAQEREISRSGSTVLSTAFDQHLGRTVLKKTWAPEPGLDTERAEGDLERFAQEARLTARLTHPNVIAILDVGEDDEERPYFTMPQLGGTTFAEALQRHRTGDPEWPRTRLLAAIIGACEGLAHAHDRGIVHGGLSADRLQLGRFGEVYVTDWSTATSSEVDGRHDLQALGELLQSVLHRSAPARLQAIGNKALAADSSTGYRNATELRDDLIAFRDRRTVRAYRSGPWAELSLWIARNRAVAALLLCVAIGAGVSLVALERERNVAESEAAVAAQGLRAASRSVGRLVNRLGTGMLRAADASGETTEALLEDALAIHTRIAELRPADRDAQQEFADTLMDLAAAARGAGSPDFAERALKRAAEIQRQLLEAEGSSGSGPAAPATRFRRQLVAAESGIADLELRRGAGRASVERLERVLAQAADSNAGMTAAHASAWLVRATAHEELGEPQAARAALEAARQLLEGSPNSTDDASRIRRLLLETLARIAGHEVDRGEFGVAVEAITAGAPIARGAATTAAFDVHCAVLEFHECASRVRAATGSLEEQRQDLDRAVARCRMLVHDHPGRHEAHARLARSLARRAAGAATGAATDFEAALAAIRRALELRPMASSLQSTYLEITTAATAERSAVDDAPGALRIALESTRQAVTPELRLDCATLLASLLGSSPADSDSTTDRTLRDVCRSACRRVVLEHRGRLIRGEASRLESMLRLDAWSALRGDPFVVPPADESENSSRDR